ncbi:MAG: helical backbone metal receptor [Planctomycetes bacterium]|nr:helical backbone metal receptor [Planctomycetota bacterium]
MQASPVSPATRVAVTLAFLAALSGACDRSVPAPSARVSRIVSLVPAATEILFALGAGDLVVGRSKWCDTPAAARALPAVGDALSVDLEGLLGLGPDLIVTGGGAQREALGPLAGRVRIVTALPETLDDVRATITGLATLAGREEAGRDLVARIDAALAAARERAGSRGGRRTLFAVQHEPLVVAGAGSIVGELLDALGTRNLAGDLHRPWPQMSLESVVARDPEAIVDAAVNDPREPSEFWGRFGTLTAVREGRVRRFPDPSLLRPGPRVPELLAAIEDAVFGEGR